MTHFFQFLSLFVAFYIWHGLGVTIGYHRLISHRTFSCSKFVEYFFIAAGYLAFQGSPIMWATVHRAHHRHVDTDLDPHSPRNGRLGAYIGWIAEKTYPAHIVPSFQSKDLIHDPIYKFLERKGNIRQGHEVSYAINILFRVALFFAFGWMPALASLLAGMAVLQIPLILNVLCHIPKLGYKNYAGIDDSVNVWLVGILAMGEGWHNNHHAFPGSARTGIRFFEFDLSWLTIATMSKIGLVAKVKSVSDSQLLQFAERINIADAVISE